MLYNAMPVTIKTAPSLAVFKKRLKTYLFMPLSHREATKLRIWDGKNIAKVARKCNHFYGMGE